MHYLIAQIKKRGGGAKLFKVFSGEEVYELPGDLGNPKVYSSDYKLEDDEWFYIPEFSTKDYCIDLLKNDFVSGDYDQINANQLNDLKFLCSYQIYEQEEFFFFQKMGNTQYIRKKWFSISDAPTLEKDSQLVIISQFADAIYKKSSDFLYFRNLSPLSSIFQGISNLYREATKEETELFLSSDFINLKDGYNADYVKIPNRKRIALAMETIQLLSPKDKNTIFYYIKEYCDGLEFDEEVSRFSISNEEELKQLLWGIEQRYYTTIVGNEKRVANSVSTVGD